MGFLDPLSGTLKFARDVLVINLKTAMALGLTTPLVPLHSDYDSFSVSGSPYRSGRSKARLKVKNPRSPAILRLVEDGSW